MNDLEKMTVEKMIGIYCRNKHQKGDLLCKECSELRDYAHIRLTKCVFGDNKTTCSKCSIHCYKEEMRNRIKDVMRYAAPRIVFYHPILTIKYLFK